MLTDLTYLIYLPDLTIYKKKSIKCLTIDRSNMNYSRLLVSSFVAIERGRVYLRFHRSDLWFFHTTSYEKKRSRETSKVLLIDFLPDSKKLSVISG